MKYYVSSEPSTECISHMSRMRPECVENQLTIKILHVQQALQPQQQSSCIALHTIIRNNVMRDMSTITSGQSDVQIVVYLVIARPIIAKHSRIYVGYSD